MTPFGVLWDMDGVLIDSTDMHYETWAQALAPYDIDFTRKVFDATFGMNNARILDHLFGGSLPPAEADAIGDRKEELFRQLAGTRARLLPGVRACTPTAFRRR
jgi:beta-phosphoglucomutase